MSPEEADEARQRLQALLADRGFGWLVRRVDEDYEAELHGYLSSQDVRQRLRLLIDAVIDVLTLTDDLRQAIPALLLTSTEAGKVFIADPDYETGGPPDPVQITPLDSNQRNDLGRLIGMLSDLRGMARSDV